MKKQHRSSKEADIIESKAGQRLPTLLQHKSPRCPALGFNPNSSLVSEDMVLEYLAEILVDIFLEQTKHE